MNPAARVVPDVASFSVDDGFWYSIPEHLRADLSVGTIVRVPLSGRRVRGWVVQLAADREGKLKDVAGISGEAPVFDERLLESLKWVARHYVAPISVMLARSGPPNLPRSIPPQVRPDQGEPGDGRLSGIASRSATGQSLPVTAVVSNWHDLRWLSDLGVVLASGHSVLVVAASVAEVEAIRDSTRPFAETVVAVTGHDDASDTRAWESAQSPPRIVIGTPKTATWHIPGLVLAVVLEESRRAMKDRQTPTMHVRDVMRTRSRVEGFNLVFLGPTPSVELLAAGAEVVRVGNRAWPLVEIVDRSDDAPGSGYFSERVIAAIHGAVRADRRVFVFTHRRAAHASLRCAQCRALRSCRQCASRIGKVDRCGKCGAAAGPCGVCGGQEFEELGSIPERLVGELDNRLGRGTVAVHPADTPVTVGTERDLAGLRRIDLAIAADVDGMLLGTGYRTSEEALRQLARLASLVGRGRGARLIAQTAHADSGLVTALRRGNPIPYLENVLVDRARDGAPPATEMIAVELRGDVPPDVSDRLRHLDAAAIVMGPMTVDEGSRWLLTGRLGKVRLGLRKLVGSWRDKGLTVRVDADPIDV